VEKLWATESFFPYRIRFSTGQRGESESFRRLESIATFPPPDSAAFRPSIPPSENKIGSSESVGGLLVLQWPYSERKKIPLCKSIYIFLYVLLTQKMLFIMVLKQC
jgi:hypothetical protein